MDKLFKGRLFKEGFKGRLFKEGFKDRLFKAYYVWPRFPSLSMSGLVCSLHCRHCNHKYLEDMRDVSDPEKLLETCRCLDNNGAVGVLLSGGSKKNGEMINLRKLLPAIKRVKEETNLIVKLHTGLVDRYLAEEIVSAGVDIASVEVVGEEDTIREMFVGMEAKVEDYKKTLENLSDAGMKHIVPHVCAGLHHGKLKGEFDAIDIIEKSCKPSVMVIIALKTTPGIPIEFTPPPKPEDVGKVVAYAKKKFSHVEVSLGCMRPRAELRDEIEKEAILAGVNRIEIPSKKTLDFAQSLGYKIKRIDACCALPEEYEDFVKKRIRDYPNFSLNSCA